jgi:bifunctional DNA-binding transcriptional regulator/antitoxin component of YhaV-PrlF toxin-antitoxin module
MKHPNPKRIDEIGRIQIPQYIRNLLNIQKDDTFVLDFDTRKKVITLILTERSEVCE